MDNVKSSTKNLKQPWGVLSIIPLPSVNICLGESTPTIHLLLQLLVCLSSRPPWVTLCHYFQARRQISQSLQYNTIFTGVWEFGAKQKSPSCTLWTRTGGLHIDSGLPLQTTRWVKQFDFPPETSNLDNFPRKWPQVYWSKLGREDHQPVCSKIHTTYVHEDPPQIPCLPDQTG